MQRIKLNSHDMMELARGLIGRHITVLNSSDRTQIGIEGTVLNETLNTIVVLTKNKRVTLPKKGLVFKIQLSNANVVVEGRTLIQRPDERIRKWWKKIQKVKRHDNKSKRSGMQ